MKVNKNLLQKLKEKNINLDIDRYSKQLKNQSNAPTQVSSSEVDSMDSSFMMQSINFTPAAGNLNSNFRVRPLSAKRDDCQDMMGQSQMGFSLTQNQFNKKSSQKTLLNSNNNNNSQYQHIIDQRLNQKQPTLNSRTSNSSSSTINKYDSETKIQTQSTQGNNIKMKTLTQSFYKDNSQNESNKKDNGMSSTIKSKPPLPNNNSNNDQNLLRQSSVRERKGSDDAMRVSMYKDSKQNKIREDLLNMSGEDSQFSDTIQQQSQSQQQSDDNQSDTISSFNQRPSSSFSKRKSSNNYDDVDDEISNINTIQKSRENVFEERNKTNNINNNNNGLLRKSQSVQATHSRNNIEDQIQEQEQSSSKQELDALLQQYDNNRDENDSQNNSFDEELMIQVEQEFISESITAELIEKITDIKQDNFDKIRRITLRHDCEQDSLQLLGEMCPNIIELNINDSIASSLRDIGTSMRNLKVLWISRVKLQDFSGFNAFPQLIELYASYNSIKNLSDLYFNESLEVLDLEGNDITENDQIEALETLSKIKMLTLQSNPICKKENYRQNIRQKIPQLILLDDIPIDQDNIIQQPSKTIFKRRGLPINSKQQQNQVQQQDEEEEDLYECIKKLRWGGELLLSEDVIKELDQELKQELNEEDLLLYSVKKTTNKANKKMNNHLESNDSPSSKNMKNNSNIFGTTLSNFSQTASNFRRPQTAATSKNNNINTNSSNPFAAKQQLPDSLSSLVEGTDQAFYGNPLKALKHKRKNDFVTTKRNDNNSNNNNDNTNNNQQMNIPKNIVNLLDQFKQETNDEGVNKLKEELKFYDFMVEQQINLQKKKSIGNGDIYSNSQSNSTASSIIMKNSNINNIQDPSLLSSMQKSKIVIKRPQIKLRPPSTNTNEQNKNLITDQQFNIQSQFKELQIKSRLPVKASLLQSKTIENTIN